MRDRSRGALELEGELCYHPVGGIELATTAERWAELDRRYGRALSYGLDAELLDPDAVRERIPLLDASTILGGLQVRSDGIAKALRAAEAMGRHAADAGSLRAFGGCAVTGLDVSGGRIRAVETTRGTIRADRVVVCAGIWGPRVLRLAGVRLPLMPVAHQYAVTTALPELVGERREVVHPICATRTAHVLLPGRGRLRDRGPTTTSRCWSSPTKSPRPGRAGGRPSSRSRPPTSPRRARRPAGCCPRWAARSSRRRSTG